MELVVISDPASVENEAAIINSLFKEGMCRFHLRKPLYTSRELRELLCRIEIKYYRNIALHQHHDIANEFGINRLHFTEKARVDYDFKKKMLLIAEGYILSTSVHDFLMPSLKGFDYVFYGPVFNSISKTGYQSNLPVGFYLDKGNIQTRVIALGGIEISQLTKVKKMNFDGVAVLGAIWNKPDQALINFKCLKEALSKLESND